MSIKEWMTRVMNALKVDYVVEEGTDGIWTYRKWASGIAECWGTTRITYTGFQAWGNDFETNASVRNINYPTGLFISTPKCNMQIDSPCSYGLYLEVYGSGGSKDRTPNFAGVRPNSVSISGTAFHNVSVDAKGRWKNVGGGYLKALFSRLSVIFVRGWQYVFKGIAGEDFEPHSAYRNSIRSELDGVEFISKQYKSNRLVNPSYWDLHHNIERARRFCSILPWCIRKILHISCRRVWKRFIHTRGYGGIHGKSAICAERFGNIQYSGQRKANGSPYCLTSGRGCFA